MSFTINYNYLLQYFNVYFYFAKVQKESSGIGRKNHLSSTLATEAKALHLGLLMAKQHNWQRLILEIDNRGVIQELEHLEGHTFWEITSVVSCIQELQGYFVDCRMNWFPRQVNKVVDFYSKLILKTTFC